MPNKREKLIELCHQANDELRLRGGCATWGDFADHLIANGVTIQRWIPVSERLPERDGRYLCNYHFGEHRDMTFTRVLDYYATDKIPHFQHTLGDTTMKVTHWMPLPLPPKEGE